jgi:predicted tellurium resistance membrane protein TerC
MEWLTDPNAWIALAALTSIEVVLGIDNIIFLTILVGGLPEEQRQRARVIGLTLAMAARLALLFSLTWFMGLTEPVFTVFDHGISLRDLILIVGGLFLLGKATFEIHDKLEGQHEGPGSKAAKSFGSVMLQIALLDIVFSIDSVITAIGLADQLAVMVVAVVIAVLVMLVSAKPIGEYVEQHPTLKILALSFLLLIGTTLVAEGLGFHFPKGYVYFAMAFSAFVEMLNLRIHRLRASRA